MKEKFKKILTIVGVPVIILLFWITGGLVGFIATPIWFVLMVGWAIFGIGWFIYHFLTGFSHVSVDVRNELKVFFLFIFLMSLTIGFWSVLIQQYGHPVLMLLVIAFGWILLLKWFDVDIKVK